MNRERTTRSRALYFNGIRDTTKQYLAIRFDGQVGWSRSGLTIQHFAPEGLAEERQCPQGAGHSDPFTCGT